MSEREQITKVSQMGLSQMTQSSFFSTQRLFPDLIGELLGRGHRVLFRANGKSMHPTIKDGETVTIEPVETSDVKRGDIILYRRGLSVIAHRVEAIRRRHGSVALFFLRGDASDSSDQPVRPEQVLGKVVSVQRGVRRIDLTGRRAVIRRRLRAYASRLKRCMTSKSNISVFKS
jgi:signal peptidase I